jgi:FkbM family methyltransferase
MKKADGWWWPDHERHLLEWLTNPKARVTINGRVAYQGKKQLAALDVVPAAQRTTAIDVGGHCGTWSFNLAHWFQKVEAFEPVPEHRECFLANLTNVPVAPKVTLHPFALGANAGRVAIVTEKGSSGNSMVKGAGQVEMRILDSFDFQNVGFIKVDVEGFEENVLRGGEQMLRKWKPVAIIEQKREMSLRFDLKPLGAVSFLKSLGYETVREISGDYIMRYTG